VFFAVVQCGVVMVPGGLDFGQTLARCTQFLHVSLVFAGCAGLLSFTQFLGGVRFVYERAGYFGTNELNSRVSCRLVAWWK